MYCYRYKSKAGTFYIYPTRDGWTPYFEDEDLGGCGAPQTVLDDLAGGHSFFHSSGIDPSTCGLPEEIEDWERVPLQRKS